MHSKSQTLEVYGLGLVLPTWVVTSTASVVARAPTETKGIRFSGFGIQKFRSSSSISDPRKEEQKGQYISIRKS